MDRIVIILGFLTALLGVGMAAECYDSWYLSPIGDYDHDYNTATGLGGVHKETCSGSCYTLEYEVLSQFYVKQGCKENCENGTSKIDEIKYVKAETVCCTGDLCNNEIFSNAVTAKLSLPVFIISASVATLLTFKLK